MLFKNHKRKLAAVTALVFLLGAALSGCGPSDETGGSSATSAGEAATEASAATEPSETAEETGGSDSPASEWTPLSGEFAANPGYTYSGTPSVPEYSVEAALGNIENKLQFTTGYPGKDFDGNDILGFWLATTLTDETTELIERNGFAVSDNHSYREFFELYERNRYGYVPSFITTDSALHSFHLVFEYVLKDLEQQKLSPALAALSGDMAAASDAQYQALKDTAFENAALRNVAFFSVGASLLDPGFVAPDYAAGLVARELALIEAAGGVAASPVINGGQTYTDATETYYADYSQYIPRSHYTLTPELTAYFKAMIWYGQTTFRSSHEDEVKSALLQTSLLEDPERSRLWAVIFEPTNFFVGECDDITYLEYADALDGVYGGKLGDLAALTEAASFESALVEIGKLEPPAINSIPIFSEELQPDKDAAITGYRFLGQRFTIDGVIMQRLMARETEDRNLPKGLDIPAAFGSEEARSILEGEGEFAAYPELAPNLEKVAGYVAEFDEAAWHSNVYWSWLDMLRPLAGAQSGAGMPFFTQNQAWTRRELNTFLASWTELKHDTLLYSKPPMAEMGGGGPEPPPPPDDRGYVEPNPEVFGRLANLTRMFTQGLDSRGLMTATAKDALGVLEYLADTSCAIAEKELADEPRTDEEYEFIRSYGGELEHIFDAAKREDVIALMGDYYRDQYLMRHPGALVSDIATDPDAGVVLQEATGFMKEMYVAFPRDGKVVLGRGLVFSQYEFTVPIAERMTDDDWHERLNTGELPAYAEWKRAFLSDTID